MDSDTHACGERETCSDLLVLDKNKIRAGSGQVVCVTETSNSWSVGVELHQVAWVKPECNRPLKVILSVQLFPSAVVNRWVYIKCIIKVSPTIINPSVLSLDPHFTPHFINVQPVVSSWCGCNVLYLCRTAAKGSTASQHREAHFPLI